MRDSGRHAVGLSRGTVAAAVGVAAATALVLGTSAVLVVAMARTVVTPPKRREEDTAVLGVDLAKQTITLSASADAVLPGEYSFWFSSGSGHARLGEIVGRFDASVTRRIVKVDHGDLAAARRGRFNGWIYLSPADLGYPFLAVEVPTRVGPAPAWLIPSDSSTDRWVIHVHGRAVSRLETLRGVPVFREAGYTSLIVSYRNDGEAPPSTDGKYALGDSEWRDIESAIKFAIGGGARSIILMGWSMGGATVLQAATRSPLADIVRGIVLESPVVEWASALDFQAKLAGLPPFVGIAARVVLGRSWGRALTGLRNPIDFDRLDFVRHASRLAVPILLLHSDDDGYVPSSASRELAQARPDIVTMETFAVARHTKLWNYDRERWEGAIARWLADRTR